MRVVVEKEALGLRIVLDPGTATGYTNEPAWHEGAQSIRLTSAQVLMLEGLLRVVHRDPSCPRGVLVAE